MPAEAAIVSCELAFKVFATYNLGDLYVCPRIIPEADFDPA